MKNKQIILCLLPVILSSLAFGQEAGGSVVNRYFVYFSDKAGDSYPYKVSNPEEFLTQRSIDRKSKQNISIKVTDLPVNPEYVQQLRDTGAEVFFSSRWFNGSLIHADTNFLSQINALAFVDSVALVADTTVLSFKKQETEAPTVFDDPPSITGNSDIQLTMLGATQMHEENVKGQGMLIAVLDNGFTGVNRFSPFQHVWEDNRIVATKDFVRNSGNVFQYGDHGTSVFSIIGANYSSAEGDLIGIAPEASFILCVTEENRSEDRVEEYNWLLAAEYADSLGADVINASVGYKTFDIPSHNYSSRDLDGETAIISRAAEMASNKGMIVVTSAGNTGRRNPPGNLMGHPADARGILAVGSVEPDFTKSDFSSVGPTT
ncbi:MAG: S8 family serine peptidase, partial [Ekhidna sp.]|nr:S8 family serine peptidase [Ekhidna sp.]